jgi:hypothetical protein
MKKIVFSILIASLLLSSCVKNDLNENGIWQAKTPDYALVRFMNSYNALTPSITIPPNGPRVNFYINDVKMNGPALSFTNYYPLVVGGGAFAQVPSGEVIIKAVLNRTTGVGLPSDTIAKGKFMLGPNVSHSIVLVDTLPNPTPFNPTLMVIQEAVSIPAYGKFKVRFMNMIANNNLYEIYNSTTATILTGPISYKNLSDWIELPASGVSQTYQLRVVGTTTVVGTPITGALTNLRSYTFWARGGSAGKAITITSMITQ